MKEPCDVCGKKPWERIKFSKFVCGTCEPAWNGFPLLVETFTILRNQPGQEVMSKREAAEIKRNVAIPVGKGKIKCGRRGENGKIQEKPIKV